MCYNLKLTLKIKIQLLYYFHTSWIFQSLNGNFNLTSYSNVLVGSKTAYTPAYARNLSTFGELYRKRSSKWIKAFGKQLLAAGYLSEKSKIFERSSRYCVEVSAEGKVWLNQNEKKLKVSFTGFVLSLMICVNI